MAKSLRSKWKRKMRAVKRERYGKKELEKLKSIVKNDPLHPSNPRDVDMTRLEAIATVTTVSKEKENEKEVEEVMEDGRHVHNPHTLKDQHGNYPVWLGSYRKKKLVHSNRATKRLKSKARAKSRKAKKH